MADQFDGDIALILTNDGGQIVYKGGQPQMDAGGLETSVNISLFTGLGYWANALDENEPDNQIGSIFEETVTPHAITIQRLRKIELEGINALQWMININAAKEILFQATSPELNIIEIVILITKPDGAIEEFKYSLNWESGFLRPVPTFTESVFIPQPVSEYDEPLGSGYDEVLGSGYDEPIG